MRKAVVAAGVAILVAAVAVPLLVLHGGTPESPVVTAAGYTVPATTSRSRADTALTILGELRSGDYADVRRGFDPEVAAGLSESQLAAAWEQFLSQFGSYRARGSPTQTQADGFWVVRIPLTMSRLPGELRVAYDTSGRIAGLFFLRPGIPVGHETTPLQPNASTAHAAEAVLADLVRGDDAAVEARFDSTMKAAVSQGRLRSVWKELTSRLGAYESSGTAVVAPVPGAVLYDFPIQLAHGGAHVQVAIESGGQVAGLYIRTGPPTGRFGQ